MISNYFKVFIRQCFKQSAFTVVNILGLALALACCLVIVLFVRQQFSFDRFFTNADALYRVGTVAVAPDGTPSLSAPTFFPVAPLLKANFPAITNVVRMQPKPSLVRIGANAFYEDGFRMVDPDFFLVFDLKWLAGDPRSALANATDVVLTRRFAQKNFGTESPLGQTLILPEGIVLRVTGVIEDLPGNTHLSGSAFAAMGLRDLLEPADTSTGNWVNVNYYTYLQLRQGVDINRFQRELDAFAEANIPSPPFINFLLKLDPVTDIHLNPAMGDLRPAGSKLNIAVFITIGICILLVACVNFVNLNTARSAQRVDEVGLRLTLGARRGQLIGQFLGESVLLVLLASMLALVMVELLLPGIQAFLELDLAHDSLVDPVSLAILLGFGLCLGLAAGWYPALLMSRSRPAPALKRQHTSLIRGMALKNVLVVVQFSIAIGMIVTSLVIWSQLRFAGTLELGYDHDRIVVITTNELGSLGRIHLLKERLLQSGAVTAATVSTATPEQETGPVFFGNSAGDDSQHFLREFPVDADYFALFNIPLLAGRLLREDMPADRIRAVGIGENAHLEGNLVLNQSGAREFGWSPAQAIGQRISDKSGSLFTVSGVVGDIIQSAHTPASPSLYVIPQGGILGERPYLSLRPGDDQARALDAIDRIWEEINPQEPIIRSFLDTRLDASYRSDIKFMHLSFIFSAMAIFISCMGLFGLAKINAERRTREIGVRKVMGGSMWNIVLLLTNDFSRLVLISNVIAWPVAYFAMKSWLENFTYRIDLTPLIFIGSGLIALCIAWVTVGGTAAKAASRKPVLALRYE